MYIRYLFKYYIIEKGTKERALIYVAVQIKMMKNEQVSLLSLFINFPSSIFCQQRSFGISPCLTQSTLFCSHITRKTKQRQLAQVIRIKNTFIWKLRLEKRRQIVGRHCVQTDRISFDISSFCTESKLCFIIKSLFFCTLCVSSFLCFKPAKKVNLFICF